MIDLKGDEDIANGTQPSQPENERNPARAVEEPRANSPAPAQRPAGKKSGGAR